MSTLSHEAINQPEVSASPKKVDADYVFHELTRSICPQCRRVIDAHIILRDDKVYMRKRCPECGPFEALVYADAQAYTTFSRYNKPGTIPLAYGSPIHDGCPHDCGLFSLPEVEQMLDDFVRTEGTPEVVQFSGGEPTLHPQIIEFVLAAKARGIRLVMINTNGKRIARDDRFLERLAAVKPTLYFQFDGFDSETYRILRGEPDILEEKLLALDRLAKVGVDVTLVPAIERGVNEHEVGRIIDFAIRHPAVRGINFQPAFHAGRHIAHDPLTRLTIPDVLRLIETQTAGQFKNSDFVPVPCCFPTCNSVTYAFIDGQTVTPLPRIVNVHEYLDYITNRVLPDFSHEIRGALEGLWSSSSVAGCKPDGGRCSGTHDHDHASRLHGSLDVQPKESDEMLQGISPSGRQANPVLRLQYDRLSGAGPGAARSDGTGANTSAQGTPALRSPVNHV